MSSSLQRRTGSQPTNRTAIFDLVVGDNWEFSSLFAQNADVILKNSLVPKLTSINGIFCHFLFYICIADHKILHKQVKTKNNSQCFAHSQHPRRELGQPCFVKMSESPPLCSWLALLEQNGNRNVLFLRGDWDLYISESPFFKRLIDPTVGIAHNWLSRSALVFTESDKCWLFSQIKIESLFSRKKRISKHLNVKNA